MSEEINTFIPPVSSGTNLLTKYIAMSTEDVSSLQGKENLKAIKSVAVGASIDPPDHTEDILENLDDLFELSEEELLERARERKEKREQMEKLLMEKREANAEQIQNLQIKATESADKTTLSILAPETKTPPTIDKSAKVAKTYTPPPKVELNPSPAVEQEKFSIRKVFSSLTGSAPSSSSTPSTSVSSPTPKLDTKA